MQSSDSVVETRLISTDLPTAWMYREQGAHDAPPDLRDTAGGASTRNPGKPGESSAAGVCDATDFAVDRCMTAK